MNTKIFAKQKKKRQIILIIKLIYTYIKRSKFNLQNVRRKKNIKLFYTTKSSTIGHDVFYQMLIMLKLEFTTYCYKYFKNMKESI